MDFGCDGGVVALLFSAGNEKHKQKEELTWKTLDSSWQFLCPICRDPERFACELINNDGQLEKGKFDYSDVSASSAVWLFPRTVRSSPMNSLPINLTRRDQRSSTYLVLSNDPVKLTCPLTNPRSLRRGDRHRQYSSVPHISPRFSFTKTR